MNSRLNCGIAGLSSPDMGATIKDNGAITIEINMLFSSLEILNRITEQLAPIIYQYPQTKDEQAEAEQCNLASQIRNARKEIERISNYLSNHQL